MKRLGKEYAEQGLKVLWVGIQDKPEKLKAFASALGIQRLGYDESSEVARSYGITYGAGLLFIDSGGMVRKRVPTGISEDTIREYIEIIIREPEDSGQAE